MITFNSDSSFIYKEPYVSETVAGKWSLTKDTLFLYSKFFDKQSDEPLSIKYQYTNLKGKDEYLIKNKKLYRIDTNGVFKGCYLLKISKANQAINTEE